MIGFLIMFGVSVLLIILGLLIWKKGRINLIHNYHQNNVKDYESYGNAMGKTVLSMGIVILITGISFLFNNLSEWISIGFLFVGLAIDIIVIVRIQKKYNGGVF